MKTVQSIVLSAFLVVSGVSSAHAMGDREQAALLGAGAVVLLGALFGSSSSGSSDATYEPAPVYYEPAPTVVYTQPYYLPSPTVVYNQPYYPPTPSYYVPSKPVVKHHYRHGHDRYDSHYRSGEYVSRGYH